MNNVKQKYQKRVNAMKTKEKIQNKAKQNKT